MRLITLILLVLMSVAGNAFAQIDFPRDEAPHDALTEWWYFAGNLQADGGETFGYELSVFKVRVLGFDKYFADIAVNNNRSREFRSNRLQFHRPRVAQSGLSLILNENVSVTKGHNGRVFIRGEVKGFAELALEVLLEDENRVLINGTGYLNYGQGAGSFYYADPRAETTGLVTLKSSTGNKTYSVAGNSWFDHQWGPFLPGVFPLNMKQSWWLSGQLEDGRNVNFFQTFTGDGRPLSGGGYIQMPDGSTKHLKTGDYTMTPTRHWTSPKSQRKYGVEWLVVLAETGEQFHFAPHFDAQEFLTPNDPGKDYYEGRGTVRSKARDGTSLKGLSLIETLNF